jgi:hypothetical protein
VVLAKPTLADGLTSAAFKIDRGGIEKDQIQFGEKIFALKKNVLFDRILNASGSKGRRIFLIAKFFTQKAHGPVEMMQIKLIDTVNYIAVSPTLTVAIGARDH